MRRVDTLRHIKVPWVTHSAFSLNRPQGPCMTFFSETSSQRLVSLFSSTPTTPLQNVSRQLCLGQEWNTALPSRGSAWSQILAPRRSLSVTKPGGSRTQLFAHRPHGFGGASRQNVEDSHRKGALQPRRNASSGGGEHFVISAESAENGTAGQPQLLEALSARQSGQIALFVDALLDWNQRMNLTAVTERSAVMERHVADSLSLLPIIEAALREGRPPGGDVAPLSGVHLVDVGTGAGLPGLVLAVARPVWQITLVESLQKRCKFLEHAVKLLSLPNVTVQCARAEDAGRGPLRETCQVAVARAVAELRVLAELCLPLVCVGGVFVAPKGPTPQEEVEAARVAVEQLGGAEPKVVEVASSGPGGQRTAVICRKARPTPAKYPRRAGMPTKRPL